ncbi:MAG: DEAD/DEAH box helicase [marine benthic group bacterium]|nr:DEAD/DEAH box helicase [Gemmatimonadota bacterium]MCL7966074.1 DEAD/DEAH box helicase [Gemmatimonadota bacterium]MCL7975891.1 DEAD/DEAH box helicase [Gemmatimonadota bacterium]MCL7978352.1 DEAD/DEAH box helicase [Gemmatimonadota bacterium]MCL7991457.1 DEAD/DEAH box helicase [Gemmatimonadota bacterium]
MSFESFKLHPDLLRGITALGFEKPTPIQTQAIPPAMDGRDLLACAQTGSGKTAAFLLPVLHQIMQQPGRKTRALVVTPTRELAAQVAADLRDLAKFTPVQVAPIFGGVKMGPQEKAFRRGVDVIVATPGRLLDHLNRPYANLDSVEYLVLDEADRMLDMGFLPDIRRILGQLPKRSQTLLFSATISREIAELAGGLMRDPVSVEVERSGTAAELIEQSIYPVEQHRKTALLLDLLERGEVRDALVFTRTKRRADRVAKQLSRQGVQAERIHGNRSQSQRTAALAGFKKGRIKVLVATDVASRGIDVEALGHVVNYDVPGAPEDYIHRIGRTGRAEMKGNAFTFVSLQEEADVRNIERVLRRKLPRIRVPGFDHGAVSWGKKSNGNGHAPSSNGNSNGNGTSARSNENGNRNGGATANGGRSTTVKPRTSRLGSRRGGRR